MPRPERLANLFPDKPFDQRADEAINNQQQTEVDL
jgi:hypothetical protein